MIRKIEKITFLEGCETGAVTVVYETQYYIEIPTDFILKVLEWTYLILTLLK